MWYSNISRNEAALHRFGSGNVKQAGKFKKNHMEPNVWVFETLYVHMEHSTLYVHKMLH